MERIHAGMVQQLAFRRQHYRSTKKKHYRFNQCRAKFLCAGFLGAYALYRRPFKLQNVYLAFMISPLAVPWVILGLALAVFLTRLDMEGSLVSVWISHTVFAAPFAMLIIRPGCLDWTHASRRLAGISGKPVMPYGMSSFP